jgi:uncharacterized membrane protein YoaK (UPF0700 family)
MRVPQPTLERAWLAVVLGAVGGFVDAIGFLTLARLFTAHMSGNSASLGANLGQGRWGEALHRTTPIPCFIAGIMLGVAVIEVARRAGVRSSMSLALALEGLLLLAFRVYGAPHMHAGEIHTGAGWQFGLLVGLLAAAMGVQTAALQRVGPWTVRTTYITGMLTDMAQEAVSYVFWRRDQRRGAPDAGPDRLVHEPPSFVRVALLAGVWCVYIAGAVCGGLLLLHWGLNALLVPLLALAVVIAADLVRPIYAPETR